jgi:5'-nucleotidase
MLMKSLSQSLLCLAAALLFIWSGAFAQPVPITILHVNDTHAHLDGFGPKNHHLEGELGGIARAATIVFRERALASNLMLLHAGDIFHGDFFYNKWFGVPELKLMAAVGFDAMAVGNHEFELGPAPLLGSLAEAFPDPSAKPFPLLSANLDLTGEPLLQGWIQPSIIKEYGGVNVGVFGMTVFDNLQTFPAPVVIEPNINDRAQSAIADLKAHGADVIICLSHLGIRYDRMLAASVAGIDFIVGGHDHLLLTAPEVVLNPDGKPTGEFYKQIGRLRFTCDPATDAVAFVDWSTLPVDKHVPEVPQIKAVVDQLKREIVAQYGRVYDRIDAFAVRDLERTYNASSPYRDTPLGNLITDAFRKKTGTQIAFTAAGLVSEKIYAGPIVGADVFRAVSYGYDQGGSGYGYRIATMKIQGAALIQALEITLAQLGIDEDFFPMVSGLTFRYDPAKYPGERVILNSVRIAGRPFNPASLYSVTSNEAVPVLLGMLGVPVSDVVLTDGFEYPVVREFIKKLNIVSYRAEGRIRDASIRCKPGGENAGEGEMVAEENVADPGNGVTAYALEDSYPNPFNPSTTIRFALPAASQVSVKIYNAIGQEVATIAEGARSGGTYDITWNAKGLASGVYFCRMKATGEEGSFSAMKKLVLVK